MPGVRFSELPRTAERLKADLEAQVVGLMDQIEREPWCSRWRTYLGQTYERLGNREEAIQAYRTSLEASDAKDGGKAWACYRIACCLRLGGDYTGSVRACLEGLEYRPDFAELYYMVSICSYDLGDYPRAIAWAKAATAHSWRREVPGRRGTKDPRALFEGPWEVIALSRKAQGDTEAEARDLLERISALGLHTREAPPQP